MLKLLLIAIGGGFGSILRFYVNNLFPFDGSSFPKATFLVNVSASLVLGFFTALILAKFPNESWLKYLILIGFCGAFSTFSTFAMEIHSLGTNHLLLNIGYTLSSIIFSVLAIALGFYIVKLF